MPRGSSKKPVDEPAPDAAEQPSAEPAPEPPPPAKNPAAVALGKLGKLGGAKGGAARAKKLTAEERSEIAKKAAAARWKKTEK